MSTSSPVFLTLWRSHSTFSIMAQALLSRRCFWRKQCVHQYAPYILVSFERSFDEMRSASGDGRAVTSGSACGVPGAERTMRVAYAKDKTAAAAATPRLPAALLGYGGSGAGVHIMVSLVLSGAQRPEAEGGERQVGE